MRSVILLLAVAACGGQVNNPTGDSGADAGPQGPTQADWAARNGPVINAYCAALADCDPLRKGQGDECRMEAYSLANKTCLAPDGNSWSCFVCVESVSLDCISQINAIHQQCIAGDMTAQDRLSSLIQSQPCGACIL